MKGNRKGYIYPDHKVVYPLFPKRGESYIPIIGKIPSDVSDGDIVRFKKTPGLGVGGHAIGIEKIRKQRGIGKAYLSDKK